MKKVKVKFEVGKMDQKRVIESARKEGGYSGVTSKSKRIKKKVFKKRLLHLLAQCVAEHQ